MIDGNHDSRFHFRGLVNPQYEAKFEMQTCSVEMKEPGESFCSKGLDRILNTTEERKKEAGENLKRWSLLPSMEEVEGENPQSTLTHTENQSLLPSLDCENLIEVSENTASETHVVAAPSTDTVLLSDDLRDKIIKQVEYYFSDENLPRDNFLMKYVKRNKEGFVPISVIASFRKMKKLVKDCSLIADALCASSHLVVSSDGTKVKRFSDLPDSNVEEWAVLVENLPEDHSEENIRRIFHGIGYIKNICIHDPRSGQGAFKANMGNKMISSKLHALVELRTKEMAEKAVATLNDETNWRSGMRVKLLLKQKGKYILATRSRKGKDSEKEITILSSEVEDEKNTKAFDKCDETTPEDVNEPHEAGPMENEKHERTVRIRRHGKGHGQHSVKGHGTGRDSAPHGSSYETIHKPIPGPRMPDGTRGFTMGRGKPFLPDLKLHHV